MWRPPRSPSGVGWFSESESERVVALVFPLRPGRPPLSSPNFGPVPAFWPLREPLPTPADGPHPRGPRRSSCPSPPSSSSLSFLVSFSEGRLLSLLPDSDRKFRGGPPVLLRGGPWPQRECRVPRRRPHALRLTSEDTHAERVTGLEVG